MNDISKSDDDGEVSENGPVFTPFRISDGRLVYVEDCLVSRLKEFDWFFDLQLETVVCQDSGGKHLLYDALIRLRSKFPDEMGFPVLSRAPLRKLFGALTSYSVLVEIVTRQRLVVEDTNFSLPTFAEYLGLALSYSLSKYYTWLEEATRHVFIADPDNLTPGWIVEFPREASTHYVTLGEWMDNELTGMWKRDDAAFTGMIPLRFVDLLESCMLMAWRMAYWDGIDPDVDDDDIVPVCDVEEALARLGLPIALAASAALETIRNYKLTPFLSL